MEGSPMNMPWGLSPEELFAIRQNVEEAAASQHRDQQIDNDMQEVITHKLHFKWNLFFLFLV